MRLPQRCSTRSVAPLEAGVEVDRPDHGFEGIGGDRILVPTPVRSSARVNSMWSPRPMLRATSANTGLLTRPACIFARLPLGELGMAVVEVARDGQLEHSITEELEPFVVASRAVLAATERCVSDSLSSSRSEKV